MSELCPSSSSRVVFAVIYALYKNEEDQVLARALLHNSMPLSPHSPTRRLLAVVHAQELQHEPPPLNRSGSGLRLQSEDELPESGGAVVDELPESKPTGAVPSRYVCGARPPVRIVPAYHRL